MYDYIEVGNQVYIDAYAESMDAKARRETGKSESQLLMERFRVDLTNKNVQGAINLFLGSERIVLGKVRSMTGNNRWLWEITMSVIYIVLRHLKKTGKI